MTTFNGTSAPKTAQPDENDASSRESLLQKNIMTMIGKTISHYKILTKLGEGGMGIVYKAEDTKLDRFVAIKFLPHHIAANNDERQRFKVEAKAAAALNHPNIATIHAIEEVADEMFIVMEFIEGQELMKLLIDNGQLSIDNCLSYATQIAEGLKAAHAKGIIHRDIKSSNLMVTESGQVKIMDFGLAKISGGMQLTKSAVTLGTVAYMSPEQTRGAEVDHRTDIWAFGVVLYEMIAGQLPFKGEYDATVLYSIINDEPEPILSLRPETPTELEHVVSTALAKNRDERYQRVDEMLAELRALRTDVNALKKRRIITPLARRRFSKKTRVMMYRGLASLLGLFVVFGIYFVYQNNGAIESIAVMPFQNVKSNPDMELFSDGMAESITDKLSRLRSLKRVIARSSVLHYKNQVIDPIVIGNQLGVEAILMGSFRQRGEALFVTVELVDTQDNRHIWGNQYDSELKDILAVQDEIANSIIRHLQLKLSAAENERLRRQHTQDIEAYELYLKGRFYWDRRTSEGLQKGLELFQQAIARDPSYALAYVGLADCYIRLGGYFFSAPQDAYPKAKAILSQAMAIDSTLAEAYASLGSIKSLFDRDWFGAEKDFQRAIALNPNYAPAYQWRALNLVSIASPEAALVEARRGMQLDPFSQPVNSVAAHLYYLARNYDQAQEQARKVLEMNPHNAVMHDLLAQVYVQKSLFQEAIAEMRASIAISSSTERMGLLGFALARAGMKDEAEKVLHELIEISNHKFISLTRTALICMALGEHDEAFEWLNKAYDEERSDAVIALRHDPSWDPLRSDPRFIALLQKLGLKK